MKAFVKRLFYLQLSILLLCLVSCEMKNKLDLVEWKELSMYQLPQQVIDFYYNNSDSGKLITVIDPSVTADQRFIKVSNLTETHYTIYINNQHINIRERDFRAPFLIFDGKLYFSKSLLRKGKLMTPQDLFIYSVDLKTVLK